MEKQQVVVKLIAMLKEYQQQVGETSVEITPSTCPMTDLPNFDSYAGVLVTVNCFSKFSLKTDPVPSLFAEYDSRRQGCKVKKFTVEEVAERICGMVPKRPEEKA